MVVIFFLGTGSCYVARLAWNSNSTSSCLNFPSAGITSMNHYAQFFIAKILLKNIQWRNSSLFNKNCWENWLAVCKKLK
jgi:hypothetical protein